MEARDIAPAQADRIDAFIARWADSGAAERANFQPFVIELCALLGVDHPEPAKADPALNRYTFEYPVTLRHPDGTTSPGRIDLYRRGCFVMEAKQGTMASDRSEKHRRVPSSPPIPLVVDKQLPDPLRRCSPACPKAAQNPGSRQGHA